MEVDWELFNYWYVRWLRAAESKAFVAYLLGTRMRVMERFSHFCHECSWLC